MVLGQECHRFVYIQNGLNKFLAPLSGIEGI